MRARIQPAHRLTNAQRKAADAYVREEQADIVRRMMKIMIIALNTEYGFGKIRCGRILAAINEAAEDRERDEVFWTHVDQAVKQIGFDFESEDWKEGFS